MQIIAKIVEFCCLINFYILMDNNKKENEKMKSIKKRA
jgi:hypothetical protein